MKSIVNDTVTYFVGKYYTREVNGSSTMVKKYYTAGTKTIAMRTIEGSTNTLNWLLTDPLGSTSTTANEDGSWNSTIKYTAFGDTRETSGITPTKYRYTGQLLEAEVGLYYYVARFYDPVTMHFTQADTVVQGFSFALSYNRYSYVLYNPINANDPSGHVVCDEEGYCNDGKGWWKINGRDTNLTIKICGMKDGGNCSDGASLGGYTGFSFDVDDCGTKTNCAEHVNTLMNYYVRRNPSVKFSIIGHSAGADAAILATDKAIDNGMAKNINGIALLDPTLTSSEGYGYPDYKNMNDEKYGTDDDLGSLLPKIMANKIPVFVGCGKEANNSDPDNKFLITKYFEALEINQTDLEKDLFSYNYFSDLLHYEMGTDQDKVLKAVLEFLK